MDVTRQFVKDEGTGKFYEKIANDEGEYDFVELTEKLDLEEMQSRDDRGNLRGTGVYLIVRDKRAREEQRQGNSHLAYFEKMAEESKKDPKAAKQTMKRIDKLQEQFQQLAIDRVSPVGAPSVERVTDEQFMNLQEQYKKDEMKGLVRDPQYRETMFVPLSAYVHKLQTSSGKVIRSLYVGEVGMIGPKILCLEDGYGSGTQVTVPEKLEEPS